MTKEILCGFGGRCGRVAGWLGSYGGQESPDVISRGLFAGEVGAPRPLRLFERHALPSTWFVPGHSIETFPEQFQQVVDAGHEIGVHEYSHENPIAMDRTQGAAVLDRCIALIEETSGRRPTGYVGPGESSRRSPTSCCSIGGSPTTTRSCMTTSLPIASEWVTPGRTATTRHGRRTG